MQLDLKGSCWTAPVEEVENNFDVNLGSKDVSIERSAIK